MVRLKKLWKKKHNFTTQEKFLLQMMTRLSHCSLELCEESYKRVPGFADVAGFKWTEMCWLFAGQGTATGWPTNMSERVNE